MAIKTQPLSGARAGLGSVIVTDTSQGTWVLPNVGVGTVGVSLALGAAQMDGQALVQFTSGAIAKGAAQMDGVGGASFGGNLVSIGAAQMDGLTSPAFHGAAGGGAAHMDGAAQVSFAAMVTGGSHIGAAQMNGAASVTFGGVASQILSATAHMDGQGSMLAVAAAAPLPPHGIILVAGI